MNFSTQCRSQPTPWVDLSLVTMTRRRHYSLNSTKPRRTTSRSQSAHDRAAQAPSHRVPSTAVDRRRRKSSKKPHVPPQRTLSAPTCRRVPRHDARANQMGKRASRSRGPEHPPCEGGGRSCARRRGSALIPHRSFLHGLLRPRLRSVRLDEFPTETRWARLSGMAVNRLLARRPASADNVEYVSQFCVELSAAHRRS